MLVTVVRENVLIFRQQLVGLTASTNMVI